ncbi:hypothetical protein VB741_11825 [Leptothoe sp. PORK10 BA2]|nr:hypothetical protein [Leptothoe sp. PORK10 BA2]
MEFRWRLRRGMLGCKDVGVECKGAVGGDPRGCWVEKLWVLQQMFGWG